MSPVDLIGRPLESVHANMGTPTNPSVTVALQVMLKLYPATGGPMMLIEVAMDVGGTGKMKKNNKTIL